MTELRIFTTEGHPVEPNKEEVFQEVGEQEPKKPYAVPRLTVHGSVEAITQAGDVSIKDAMLGGSTLA